MNEQKITLSGALSAILASIERAAHAHDIAVVGPMVSAYVALVDVSGGGAIVDNVVHRDFVLSVHDRLDKAEIPDGETMTRLDIALSLASSAPKLRAELDSANAEVQRLHGEMRKANDYVARCGSAAPELNAIRDTLAAVGFHGDKTPLLVETVLESLRDAQKERDATSKENDDVRNALEVVGFDSSVTLANAVCSLVRQNKDLASKVGSLQSTLHEANAECAKLREELKRISGERYTLAKQLAATQHALRLANTQMGVAHANLLSALELQQQVPIDGTKRLVRELVSLIAFWRKGDESFIHAADHVERLLHETHADLLREVAQALRDKHVRESSPLDKDAAAYKHATFGVAMHSAHKDEPVMVDVSGAFRTPGPFSPDGEMPNFFPCGCSKFKVMAGHCNAYDEFGKHRPRP